MDTAPLKTFATRARTDLIAEVSAGIRRVLAPASPERVEQPGAVAALEKAVSAAGGGEAGRAAVADRVAYTWFNRIIALRFMDANGYTGVGVVSPARGQQGAGQPEILAEAKRGTIDTTVVTDKRTVEAVTGLLDGTRRSDDPQGEAYALLLAEYCRHWNRAMPFMFEREGDYTELLIPANLLADESVLARAVGTLTEDVCRDVEVIGWLYQFYISERKDEVFAGFKKNKKAGAAEIPAATQLFTPHWIVRYLVENSLGRLWLLNRPTSRLADQMDYYITPVDEETDFLKIASPEELNIIDPACGSGHMLTHAFDLLYAIYEEEGYAPADIPSLILTNNLYGTEIDPRAGALAAFALTMKARARQRTFFNKQVEPNVCVLEPIRFTPQEIDVLLTPTGDRHAEREFWNQFEHADTFGSLIQPDPGATARLSRHLEDLDDGGDILISRLIERAGRVVSQARHLAPIYSVVVANPPYMGRTAMDPTLAAYADRYYPASKSDLFAMFIDRARVLTVERGVAAMITMQSWMFLPSLERLRKALLTNGSLSTLAHIGPRGFDSISGEVVQTCAFVWWRGVPPTAPCVWLRLVSGASEAAKSQLLMSGRDRYELPQAELLAIPGAKLGYWLSPTLRGTYRHGTTVGDLAFSGGRTKTGDNDRFLRMWWEVSKRDLGWGRRWVMHPKGGGNRRWFGNVHHVIDWSDESLTEYRRTDRNAGVIGEAFWDRPGISWTNISSSTSLGFRVLSRGEIFNLKAPTIYLHDDGRRLELLGYLNSPVVSYLVSALNPTISFNINDVLALPWRDASGTEGRVDDRVSALIELAQADWYSFEETSEFSADRLVGRETTQIHLQSHAVQWRQRQAERRRQANELEYEVFSHFIDRLELGSEVNPSVELEEDTLRLLDDAELATDLVSYAVGCMFGRYSLDEPGLILANQGDTLQDYFAKVPNPLFAPDRDNVIPIVDGDWFEDDIVARFRKFLRAAFGEQYFEENLRFVTESLGVRDIRDFFVRSFYKDHVQRYKKRPIYWLFSSPKGSFNALIYMHRYTPSTVSTVLNEYLREFKVKLEASRLHHERLAAGGGMPRQQAAALKEVDRLRKVLLELDEYEHDVLYPLATQQVAIDLDDGVKANYPKFGAALKKIPGLEASDD